MSPLHVGSCPECGATFTKRTAHKLSLALSTHAVHHRCSAEKHYRCKYCHAEFEKSLEKDKHQKTHLAARNHAVKSGIVKNMIHPCVSGKALSKLREIHAYLQNSTIEQSIEKVISFYYDSQEMSNVRIMNKIDEKDKLEELAKEAGKRGHALSKDAARIIKAMFNRKKKLGGLYCPCRNIGAMKDDDKKKYACPCIDADKDIKETGACHCGLFIKIENKA